MTEPNAIARDYLALWNDASDEARRARLSNQWAVNARYADPMMKGDGIEGIAAMIAGARSQFPGHTFTLVGTPDGHHRYIRFSWSLAPTGGPSVAGGTDVVRLDDAGRIAEVIGFLDGAVA